jgi:hypothetical protein
MQLLFLFHTYPQFFLPQFAKAFSYGCRTPERSCRCPNPSLLNLENLSPQDWKYDIKQLSLYLFYPKKVAPLLEPQDMDKSVTASKFEPIKNKLHIAIVGIANVPSFGIQNT